MAANPSITTQSAVLQFVRRYSRELRLFAIASLVMGMAYSMVDATFNNYLNGRFTLTGFERSFLEFPRELPGFLVVFVSAALWFLSTRRLGALSLVLSAIGIALISFVSPTYAVLVGWLFIYSMGQHLFMPIASTIGMELAEEGKTGRRLGQLNAIRNLAAILGSFVVFISFHYLGLTFQHTFVFAAVAFAIAALLIFSMQPEATRGSKMFLQLHKEYRLYYVLSILSGSRKQLFITFAPWVLVNIFGKPTEVLATLLTIGGVIGILFQPLLGWLIDRYGERVVLASEAVLLIFVCAGYGLARFFLPEDQAFLLVCVCYLFDQMLFSVSMARSTYIKKIAKQASDIQPALTVSVTIDHAFSILAALVGGLIWNTFGFQYVFVMGACIAVINFFAAIRVKIPEQAI